MKKKLKFDEINKIAEKFAKSVKPNTVIALIGDLGTGKTTFVKTFAKTFGITENLKSPTFNYCLEYKSGRLPLYHFDVYRLGSAEEIYEIGYEDYLENGGVVLIEWANIIESELPKNYIKISFEHCGSEDERIVEIEAVGKLYESEVKDVGFGN